MDDMRYALPEPMAQPWLDPEPHKSLNRRSLLRKVALGSALGLGTGFQVRWPGAASARTFKAPGEKGWGDVKGRIVWQGEGAPPKPREIDLKRYGLAADAFAWFTSKGPVYTEDWVVNPKGLGLRFVFVWLIPSSKERSAKLDVHPTLTKLASDTVVMEQPCSGFSPHALALRQGQKLVVTNESPVSHSFQWSGLLQNGNIAMAPGTKITVGDLLAHRQPLRVACAPHPWEGAWIRVFDHPYFAVTDAEGRFEIKNAPEGDHRIVIWHETAGWLGGNAGRNGEKITINSGGIVDLGSIGLQPRTA